MKEQLNRAVIYFFGLIVLALGIVLNTKTLLGVSPIISIPYNVCQIGHFNLGITVFIFYSFCVLVEAVIKGKNFKIYDLLQIPMSLVTSMFINFFEQYLNLQPDTVAGKFLLLIAAVLVTGIGAATMVNMKLIPNPADALAAAIGEKIHRDMGLGKNIFDFTCFCIALVIGFAFTGHIIGIGIGTLFVVIFTGRVIAVYNYLLKVKMQVAAGLLTQEEMF